MAFYLKISLFCYLEAAESFVKFCKKVAGLKPEAGAVTK